MGQREQLSGEMLEGRGGGSRCSAKGGIRVSKFHSKSREEVGRSFKGKLFYNVGFFEGTRNFLLAILS